MEANMLAKDLNRIIRATRRFISDNPHRPAQQYIKLDFSKDSGKVTACAIDGYRLSIEKAPATSDEDFAVYLGTDILKAKKEDLATITLDGCYCYIRIGMRVQGYVQPIGDFFDYKKFVADLQPPTYRISFNTKFLMDALQSVKESIGSGLFKQPVVIECRGNMNPAILKHGDNLKVVLPVRTREDRP